MKSRFITEKTDGSYSYRFREWQYYFLSLKTLLGLIFIPMKLDHPSQNWDKTSSESNSFTNFG